MCREVEENEKIQEEKQKQGIKKRQRKQWNTKRRNKIEIETKKREKNLENHTENLEKVRSENKAKQI